MFTMRVLVVAALLALSLGVDGLEEGLISDPTNLEETPAVFGTAGGDEEKGPNFARRLQEETDHTDEDEHTDEEGEEDHDHEEEEESSSACSTHEHHDEEEEEKESGLDASKAVAIGLVFVSAVAGIGLWAKCPVLSSPKFISYINTMTGGMFVSLALIHIVPESITHMPCSLATMFTSEESSVGIFFFIMVGFCLVLFFERVLVHWGVSSALEENAKAADCTEPEQLGNAQGAPEQHHHAHSHVPDTKGTGALVLLTSLSVHSVFEGIVIGTSETVTAVWLLAFTVVAHKWAAAFAIASRLPAEEMKKRFGWALLAVFCLSSPAGGLLGLLIDTMAEDSEGQAALFVKVMLNCIAVGTLLYIGFVEVVAEEFSTGKNAMSRFGLFVGSAAVIFGLTLLHNEYGHHDE